MNNPSVGDVPLCDLRPQWDEFHEQFEETVRNVLSSGQVILGPEVAALENEVARWCGASHAIGCGSGTDALLLALSALNIGPGDEVIIPPFTFFATAGAVCRAGAKPVFADIDPRSYNLDPMQVANKITSRTRAVIPVHLFGQCVDMEPLWNIAERHNLSIVEDAAQAMGASYQGKRAGTLGSMACFSFYPSKILGAYGDAGMVVTNDPEWAARTACLRVHGMEPKYYHKYLGWNARLDAVQAALLRVKLPHLDRFIAGRQEAAKRYDWLIDQYHLGDLLERPTIRPHCKHVYGVYTVRVAGNQRDALMRHLKMDRVGCDIYYPVPLHLQECLGHLGYGPGDFPVSEDASRTVLSLPMFPELTMAQQERVMQSCAGFVRQRSRRAA